MFRTLFIVLLFPLIGFASPLYTVHIAVYKNHHSLQKKIDQLPPVLRKTLYIRKRGKLHIVSTLPTSNKKILKKLLPAYRKVFSDAFIAQVKTK